MRIDCLDKLDKIHYYNTLHSNLVKWWSVNMIGLDTPQEENGGTDTYDPDAAAEELLADALGYGNGEGDYLKTGSDPRGYGYGLDGTQLAVPSAEDAFGEDSGMDPDAAAAAREIFDRLQAEAAADEAAKQAEIEAALRAANDAG